MSRFELDALRKHPDTAPVMMLNLVKFRPQSLDGNGTGRDAYTRYTDVAQRLIEERGGRAIWVGMVDHAALHEGGDIDWDLALLVHYPSRAAFIDMVTSSDYLDANVDRRNGVEKHMILATTTMISALIPEA